ncbi:MAG: prolyl oligopeptidase family serine peptidase, partial [bacterium]|nr:prolyl oligopeptidase family serine peptidase [bacterium]
IANMQIAGNNPERGMVATNRSGITQLYAWETATGNLRQITNKPAGVVFGGISPDGEYIYYHDDEQGNEHGHYVRVPFGGGKPEDMSPDLPLYDSFSMSQSLNNRLFGFLAAGKEGFQFYTTQVGEKGELSKPSLLYTSRALSVGPSLSYNADYAVIATTERSKSTDMCLMAFNLADASAQQTVLILEEAEGSIEPVGFAPLAGDTRLLATTDVSGYNRPLIWDVKTGDRIDIPLDDLEGDINTWGWSKDGKKLLLARLFQAEYQIYIYDLDKSLLTKINHPTGSYFFGTLSDDGTEIFAISSDATHPARVVAISVADGSLRTVLAAGDVPASRPWRSIHVQSTGGATIQAWVATPEGEGPFPTILNTHGGPTAVQTETFSASAQTFLDHGFAWVSVNYRGSITFGREFERSILGMLGHREIDDMAAVTEWLIENGISQADSIILNGGSYGGYLTLQGLGKRPELWAGGMALVAIADWVLMYEDQAETLRGYQKSLFGGTPDELPDQHKKSSPISYVNDIRAPILVIQGENDTRCPARQMKVYEQKLKEAGKDIHVHWFNAGHGSRAMEQNIEQHELMLRWLYRVLG